MCSHEAVEGGSVAGRSALMESKELSSSLVPHNAANTYNRLGPVTATGAAHTRQIRNPKEGCFCPGLTL